MLDALKAPKHSDALVPVTSLELISSSVSAMTSRIYLCRDAVSLEPSFIEKQ